MNEPSTVDFHVRGRVNVRLANVGDRARRWFARWSGCEPGPIEGEPHLTVRHEPDLTARANDAGRERLVRATCFGRSGAVDLPFERLGTPCEIACDAALPPPALLRSALNLAALDCGVLPLHAAGFDSGGGCLVTGPGGAGKTGALLAALRDGASFVCAEWAFVDPDGRAIAGALEPVRVRARHLRRDPALRRRLTGFERARISMPTFLARLVPGSRLAGSLLRHAYVDVAPARLTDHCARQPVPFDRLVVLARVDRDPGPPSPLAPAEAARELSRLAVSDHEPLLVHYRRYLERFPERGNPRLDGLGGTLEQHFGRAIAGKRIERVELSGDGLTQLTEGGAR